MRGWTEAHMARRKKVGKEDRRRVRGQRARKWTGLESEREGRKNMWRYRVADKSKRRMGLLAAGDVG